MERVNREEEFKKKGDVVCGFIPEGADLNDIPGVITNETKMFGYVVVKYDYIIFDEPVRDKHSQYEVIIGTYWAFMA